MKSHRRLLRHARQLGASHHYARGHQAQLHLDVADASAHEDRSPPDHHPANRNGAHQASKFVRDSADRKSKEEQTQKQQKIYSESLAHVSRDYLSAVHKHFTQQQLFVALYLTKRTRGPLDRLRKDPTALQR
jgi:hypothetical protein